MGFGAQQNPHLTHLSHSRSARDAWMLRSNHSLITIHYSLRVRVLVGALVLPLFLSLFSQGAAAQESPPLVVDAQQVVYDDVAQTIEATGNVSMSYRRNHIKADFVHIDLRAEQLEARGHVTIIDSTGRELRGETLTFDARGQVIELSPAEAIVDGVYIRSDRIRSQPGLLVAGESTVTACDPAHPLYRLTASSLEVIPGNRAVVNGATLWVGRYGIITLPALIVSLRSPKETAGSFPSAGYTSIEGVYFAYRFAFLVGAPLAYFSTSLGALAQRAEVGLELERPLGSLPLSLTAAAGAGWHHEVGLNIETTRLQYSVGLKSSDIQFGPQTDWQTAWKWTDAVYGTGDRQGVLRLNSAVTHHLATDATLTLSRITLRVYPATLSAPPPPPLALDFINPEDLIDELRLEYAKTGTRGDAIAPTFKIGAFYDYLPNTLSTDTTSATVTYGERVANHYHWQFEPEYNLDKHFVTLITDNGVALGTDFYFMVQVQYEIETPRFQDLDYIVTAQIRNCFELSVKYRQIRQELWISLGISPSPQWQTPYQAERYNRVICDS